MKLCWEDARPGAPLRARCHYRPATVLPRLWGWYGVSLYCSAIVPLLFPYCSATGTRFLPRPLPRFAGPARRPPRRFRRPPAARSPSPARAPGGPGASPGRPAFHPQPRNPMLLIAHLTPAVKPLALRFTPALASEAASGPSAALRRLRLPRPALLTPLRLCLGGSARLRPGIPSLRLCAGRTEGFVIVWRCAECAEERGPQQPRQSWQSAV